MLKCIAIDDEPLAVRQLDNYIRRIPALERVGLFRNALDARDFLKTNDVDLIFVDINMPDWSGVDFVRSLDRGHPMVIFTTAYSEYAVEGFRLDAVDYLLKPFGFNDFSRAVEKACSLHELRGTAAAAACATTAGPADVSASAALSSADMPEAVAVPASASPADTPESARAAGVPAAQGPAAPDPALRGSAAPGPASQGSASPESAPAPASVATAAPEPSEALPRNDGFLSIKTGYKISLVRISDIVFIESEGEYVRLHLADGTRIMTLFRLKNMEAALPRDTFMRTHRSYIVNLTRISGYVKGRVYLSDTEYVPIGENYREAFQHYIDEHYTALS